MTGQTTPAIATGSSCISAAAGNEDFSGRDMTLAGLLTTLQDARGRTLAFTYGGRTTKPGYHVTEIKSARITGLDCGANVENWSETVFQLWDIEESVTGEHMTVDTLIGIIAKYKIELGADDASRLVFEVSEDGEAMRIYEFSSLSVGTETATIALQTRGAQCKPLVRGLITPTKGSSGAGPKTAFSVASKKPTCCG